METSDLSLIAEQCERWNKGKLYEIFGEYAEISPQILKEKDVKCWLCYEDDQLSGFTLARRLEGFFVLEEMWATFDGLFGDKIEISVKDMYRVGAFKRQVLERIERPSLIRGAIENHFAHGIARGLNIPWFNGLVLGERILTARIDPLNIPEGYALRDFKTGDESFFSSLHQQVYSKEVSREAFRDWATNDNCKTIVATNRESPAGFIIVEKRKYKSIGDFYIAVLPSHHRRGVGGALLDMALNIMYDMGVRRIIADYRTFNAATHALYAGRGFKPVRIYNYFRIK